MVEGVKNLKEKNAKRGRYSGTSRIKQLSSEESFKNLIVNRIELFDVFVELTKIYIMIL